MTEKQKIEIETTRFGKVTVEEENIIFFPEGLIGFGPFKRYVILPNPSGGPFQWLQSVESPGLAFVICDPLTFKPDYKVNVRREDLSSIRIRDVEQGAVTVIVVIPRGGTPQDMTANLKGPIIININDRLAKQVILSGDEYEVKYPVFKEPGEARGEKENGGASC